MYQCLTLRPSNISDMGFIKVMVRFNNILWYHCENGTTQMECYFRLKLNVIK